MSEAVSAVRFDLTAETAKLQEGVKKAQAVLRSLQGSASGVQGAFSRLEGAMTAQLTRIGGMMAGAFATERIISFAQESLQAAAAIGRFADQAGLTTQQFQGLDHALRDAQVPTEQLAQGFAIFSRNMSDLRRGTGPLLDFLRRYAPDQVAAFRATRGTAEGFSVLTDAVNSLTDPMDRVRLLTAAGSEQFGRLANSMRQGRSAIEEQARGFEGLTDAQIKAAQDIQKRWDELWRHITVRAQDVLLRVAQALDLLPINLGTIQGTERALADLEIQIRSGTRTNQAAQAEWDRLTQRLKDLKAAADAARDAESSSQGPGAVPPGTLDPDAIKKAQDSLTLFMAQMNQLPSQADFVSGAFQQAWARMEASLEANGASAAQKAAARIQLIQQEAQVRQQALGEAFTAQEKFALREEELRLRRNQGILTEAEFQRALNLERFNYDLQFQQQLSGLGLELTANEQRRQSLERIRLELGEGAQASARYQRAMQVAARASSIEFAESLVTIGSALQSAFPAQKAFAIANATMNLAVAMTKALAMEGPLGWAEVAKIAAAGVSLLGTIRSATMSSSGGGAPSVGGGATGGGQQSEPAQPTQMLTLNLAPGRYSRDEVVGLIEQINEAQADGVRLVTTVNR